MTQSDTPLLFKLTENLTLRVIELSTARNPRSPSPHPRFAGARDRGHLDPDPRLAGDRGSTPIPIPDLPESGIHPAEYH